MENAAANNTLDVLKIQVLEAMHEVNACAEAVRSAIVAEAGYAQVWHDPDIERHPSESKRTYAAWAMTETDYISSHQKPQDTLIAPGVITASDETMALIDQLNAARQAFAGVCAELKNVKIKIDGKHERLVTYWLRAHGFPRINRRQTYRSIMVFPRPKTWMDPAEQPWKIAFSWCAPHRMQTINRQQLEHLILTSSASDEAIEHHMALLHSIRDTKFVQVRTGPLPQPRANLWFKSKAHPVMRPAPLPLVIADQEPLPKIKPIPEQRISPARERAWKKLIPEPFMPELNVHRYIPGVKGT